MTEVDLKYVSGVLDAGGIFEPVLELGVGYTGPTCKELIVGRGLRHYGTDLVTGPNVDIAANFEQFDDLAKFKELAPFGSVIALNVLEHTFDPIRVLDHLFQLLRPGGTLVNVTPAVWPLHDYPFDAWRLLPNFYEEYARRRGLILDPDFFVYVGGGKVRETTLPDGTYRFPTPGRSPRHWWFSRLIHRLFRTAGRGMVQPSHIAVGCVFRVPPIPPR